MVDENDARSGNGVMYDPIPLEMGGGEDGDDPSYQALRQQQKDLTTKNRILRWSLAVVVVLFAGFIFLGGPPPSSDQSESNTSNDIHNQDGHNMGKNGGAGGDRPSDCRDGPTRGNHGPPQGHPGHPGGPPQGHPGNPGGPSDGGHGNHHGPPPPGGGCGSEGGVLPPPESYVQCSTTEAYVPDLPGGGNSPQPAPLRGAVGCVDLENYRNRDETAWPPERNHATTTNIYGPMENEFFKDVPGMSCLGDRIVSGGIDTNTAELVLKHLCEGEDVYVLDTCGGHAIPYHYHERMTCLYSSDPETGHSTRIGVAADGNGIYGMHIDGGVEPTDLDPCGGRWGVTPDSNGEKVYYYPIKKYPPFTLGCYGPVDTVQECRDLYPEKCGENAVVEEITTEYGTGLYTLDCPCYDEYHSNVLGSIERPAFLPPE